MAKVTLVDPTTNFQSVAQIAENNTLIEAGFENTISRDGTSPNAMNASLDMNGNAIINASNATITASDLGNTQFATTAAELKSYLEAAGTGNVIVSTAITLTASITGVAGRNLIVYAGGSLDGAFTLTVNGGLQAGAYQIFGTSITIEGSPKVDKIRPVWWGATGDGTTDDTTAVQAAITHIDSSTPKSGILSFGAGVFKLGNLIIPITISGLTIEGIGNSRDSGRAQGTWLSHDGTGAMLDTSGSGTLTELKIRNLSLSHYDNAAGHIISTSNKITGFWMEDINFTLLNPAASLIHFEPASIARIELNRVLGSVATANSVPGINIKNTTGAGNTFGFLFQNMMLWSTDTSTSPLIRIEDASGGATSMAHKFSNVILELAAAGGGIHLYSVRHPIFEGIFADDSGANGAPIIFIDASAEGGSQEPYGSTFIGCYSQQGDATYPDVKIATGSVGAGTTFIGCKFDYVDTGAWYKGTVAISSTLGTLLNGTAPVYIRAGYMSGVTGISSTTTAAKNLSGVKTLIAGTIDIAFIGDGSGIDEADANYQIFLTSDTDEVLRVSAKATTGFTITSSVGASTSDVDWLLVR